ncbi:MAG TPA: NUDIX domain-containing protein [Allosphingosinicella sp.]|jgi:predicted NUDIX family NTP pyrophosphohydrolase
MPQESAGILLYRRRGEEIEVLLGHFGGPYWRGKDDGAWAIPKGLIEAGESPEAAARREFREEMGTRIEAPLTPLGRIRQRGGKTVEAFALEGDLDAEAVVSGEFTIEWPPGSGRFESHPEVDRAAWFELGEARLKMLPSQLPLLDLLEAALKKRGGRA